MNLSWLNLKDVTLVAIDPFLTKRTLRTMDEISSRLSFAKKVIVVAQGSDVTHHDVEILPILKTDTRSEREKFLGKRITEVFSTSHCLHVEWDCGILNPCSWDNDWLQYDFIGAPWIYPGNTYPNVGPNSCVGNFGLSLMSKRFADAIKAIAEPYDELAVDYYVCVVLRPQLEKMGIKFAPEKVAARFSCEDRRFAQQFGWHGDLTAKINGVPLTRD